jgi:hypothetical protein
MSNIDPPASWADVDGINTNERLLGGPSGPLNRAVTDLTARTKQLRDWREADVANLAAPTGAGLVGFQAAGAGSVARTLEVKAQEWVSPTDKGAAGDGVANDATALTAAGAYVTLPVGRVFRVSTNATIGSILFAGGQILVDAGVTLTVAAVSAPPSEIVFVGGGTVKIANQQWSLGWFAGATADVKWVSCVGA